ncbi:hypothetical protein BDN67DRAFT_975356, partial [Paxillus ammoniavirescens]
NSLLTMQFFLTLLASIASLSAYTLVGVHALTACTTCPSSIGGRALVSRCVNNKSVTYCQTRETYMPIRRGPRAHPKRRKILRAVLRA